MFNLSFRIHYSKLHLLLKMNWQSCNSFTSDGLIKAVGPAETIRALYSESSFDKVIDATGKCVLPGKYQLWLVFKIQQKKKVIALSILY